MESTTSEPNNAKFDCLPFENLLSNSQVMKIIRYKSCVGISSVCVCVCVCVKVLCVCVCESVVCCKSSTNKL